MQVPELTPDEIQARVLHRDGLMVVIDKPAGLPVHRGPKGGANLEASVDGPRYGLPALPPGLRCTAGTIAKPYWTVAGGGPTEEEGATDMPLGRLNEERGWWQKP